MGSTSSSQPTSEVEDLQDMSDPRSPITTETPLAENRLSMDAQYSSWHPVGHIWEQQIFSRRTGIGPAVPKDVFRPLYFRPRVNLTPEGITQPTGVWINVITISDSEKIRLGEIVSMTIDLSSLWSDGSNFDSLTAKNFLSQMSATRFENLRKLKLSRIPVDAWLWESLSKLQLDWLYVIRPSLCDFKLISPIFSGFKKLHLKLEEGKQFDPDFPPLPPLPSSLEELSLYIPDLKTVCWTVMLFDCNKLEKM
jgi:hypothetical protein